MIEVPRNRVLAHRGLWGNNVSLQNTYEALYSAVEAGFGIETDLRDFHGECVVSHDPASDSDLLTLSELIRLITDEKYSHQYFALNVKADGLIPFLSKLQKQPNCFFFDMSVPQLVSFIRARLPIATRRSEYEPSVPGLSNFQEWVWLDSFESEWYLNDETFWSEERGRKIVLVDPAIHGRDNEVALDWFYDALANGFDVYLCTDNPFIFEG